MEQSTALHREPQNKQSIESLPENAAPHPTASSWLCCQNHCPCSVVFAEEEGGNGVARAAQTVLPENPCNSEWRAGMKGKPIKHCALRGLSPVPKSVKGACNVCPVYEGGLLRAVTFQQQRDTNLCWKIFFKTRKTIKTAAGEGCKRRARKGICTVSGYILSALDLSKKENKTLI